MAVGVTAAHRALDARVLVRIQDRQLHACLVITAARRLGKAVVPVRSWEQAPCGCSAVAAHHLAMVKTRVRFPVSALMPF